MQISGESEKEKKSVSQASGKDSEREDHQTRRRKEEHKVIIKFMPEAVITLNPLKLSKALKEMIEIIESAKRLQDSKLLLFCKGSVQQKKALGLKSLMGQKFTCSVVGDKKRMRCNHRNPH